SVLKQKIEFIDVGNHVNLEVIDWGGTGDPILFLSGLGLTAHIYSDFAPQFSNKFHVYGLTRRCFGASSQTRSGYDINTLVHDILSVINTLHLKKIVLIGHSFAGAEVTKFASLYPDRVKKVIYLDAAYDWTKMLALYQNMPSTPPPTSKDFSSMQNDKLYLKKLTGVLYPDDEMKASFIFDKDGKYIGNVSPDSITFSMIKHLERPDYSLVKAPALAIYAIAKTVTALFPLYSTYDSIDKLKAERHFDVMKDFSHDGQTTFKKINNGFIKEINNAKHCLFISNPTETANIIRDFIQ
ncbi:MAG: alpha/beta fold hydrolase, partial [Janthinobacterium lividum]